MTSSNLEQIFQAAGAVPTEEKITEEVVVIKEASIDNFVYDLVEFASYLYHLNIQAHMIHLNLEAPYFLAVHKFLKKQYNQHIDDFDSLAELVRSMDFLLPMCEKGMLGACKDFKHVKSYDATESLVRYIKNLETAGYTAKDLSKMAREVDCPDGENLMAEIVNHMFTGAWMLKSTLRGG
jgi:DNA-binding ferritin-like protein|tara:strand:+ start:345 stop:884 length:540 start_codon:yes stop_codon:yes gene_type:complete